MRQSLSGLYTVRHVRYMEYRNKWLQIILLWKTPTNTTTTIVNG